MHFERLVIESGDNSISFDLHPRLTVISGLSQMERDGLVNEFIGALGNSRSGIHLELMADNGHRFAIFRPNGAAHRVIDVDERVDVTGQFVDDEGQIDLLSRAGLDPRSARRTMRFTAQDLAEATERDQLIQQLARVDQDQLWVAAEALRTAQRRLEEEADAVGSSVEDAAVIERIEQRHETFERSQTQSEQVRKVTFMIAGLAALLSLPMVRFVGTLGRGAAGSHRARRRRGVDRLLASHGVRPLRRGRRAGRRRSAVVPGLPPAAGQQPVVLRQRPSSPDHRRRGAPRRRPALVGAGRRRRRRVGQPEPLVHLRGRRLRQNVAPTGAAGVDEHHVDDTAAIAHAVVTRLTDLRNLGGSTESFPALLDEPFANVDPGVLPALLEIMVTSSEHQQIVLLTESSTVASWARVEAMTGAIGIIEPTPTARPANAL